MSSGSTSKNYPGGIDTFATWEDDIDNIIAKIVNDVQDQLIAVQTELGTDPAGSLTDVKTRLAVMLNNDGTLKNLPSNWDVGGTYNIVNVGRIGIGTTEPTHEMHIHQDDSAAVYVRFTNTTTGANSTLIGINSDEQTSLWNQLNTDMIFATNNSEKVRISANGNVGIGSSVPQAKLDVAGSIRLTGDLYNTAKTSWVPTVAVSGGTAPEYSTVNAQYKKVGNFVFFSLRLFGDGGNEGSGSSALTVTTPTNIHTDWQFIGSGVYRNSTTYKGITIERNGTNTIQFIINENNAYITGNDQNNISRYIYVFGQYEAT